MKERNISKKLTILIITIVLLVCCLCVTTYALVSHIVSVNNNYFAMSAGAAIVVNDGNPYVDLENVMFEPGSAYTVDFSVENLSTFAVYYKIYIPIAEGDLGNYIDITIREPDGTVLCSGKISKLKENSENINVSELDAGEKKNLTIEFKFASDSGNEAQDKELSYKISVEATQKKNNPEKDFG